MLLSAFTKQRKQLLVTLIGVLVCSLTGLIFEYSQNWFISTRHFSFHDAVANVFGSMLGIATF
ncbi:conserved hypothetical protein [Candidatus Methylobacter favarea]|uniref:VanZ-like domain-containing protein n=1 Tax=Candidatus Methylobacter favarea TaxID=2707345 RepID=A0A8S0WLC4_9GAMM|nr:conserved hypothetical protein [Candidatus Methylobacter favarea]